MVLSSQQARSGGTRSYMYAHGRRRVMPWGFAIVCIIVLLILGYIFWPDSDSDSNSADQTALNNNDTSITTTGNQAALSSANANNYNSAYNENSQRGNRDNATINNSGNGNNNVVLPSGVDENHRTSEGNSTERVDDEFPTITMGSGNDREPAQGKSNNTIIKDNGDFQRSTSGPQYDNKTDSNNNPVSHDNSPRLFDDGGDTGNSNVRALIDRAAGYALQNELVKAREIYNIALHNRNIGAYFHLVQQRMSELNETLIFSNSIVEGDPFVERYVIKSGDRLVHLAKDMKVDWRFIARINRIRDPGMIRLGQTIKQIRGPFHAVIDKSDYRMDIYIGQPDTEGRRMYVRSYPVGLGEFDSTPVGEWVVKPGSKLIDPPWRNPRTGEYFSSSNPDNPIGERWIGLKGLDSQTELMSGYGIHGTIEPESVGEQRSMGCIRMRPEDVIVVYEMLTENNSSVYIRN